TRSDNQFCLKYRVIFISPETALSTQFHDKVLKKRIFRENIMQLIIDESHSASEWGENFRPEYAELGKLLARLPSGLPVLLASATMPEDVLRDVLFKVGLPQNPARVAVSNAKQNVALSVRVLQHPSNTYADLYTLLPTHENEAFPQTLIYVNSRIQAEEIQDFFRTRRPSHIPAESFEFYHRNITQQRKEHIQDGLRSGRLCCVIATDALGMGMDFPSIRRVALWHEPLSFLSLIQKIGRCARQPVEVGEAILYITKVSYAKHLTVLEAEREEQGQEDTEEQDTENAQTSYEGLVDRIAIMDQEDSEPDKVQRRKMNRARSALEAWDHKHLSLFIATSGCRRVPWDEFFDNGAKLPFFIRSDDARCCDNCNPDLFPVETIKLSYPYPTRASHTTRPSDDLSAAVTSALHEWRSEAVQLYYPGQVTILGQYLLDDEVINKIAARPRLVTAVDIFCHVIPWRLGVERYGGDVVQIVTGICSLYPDPIQLAREEREHQELVKAANEEYREVLKKAFQECYDAVYDIRTGRMVKKGARNKQYYEDERKCQPFLALPRKTVWPLYYEVIQHPISISHIRNMMLAGPSKGYSSLKEFVAAWRLLFSNARTFNEPNSLIYIYADDLETAFNTQLNITIQRYNFPSIE
ncbi:P-loop containing nucleoside triphosphate hydrolase protein, partial [Lentinula raphanica]